MLLEEVVQIQAQSLAADHPNRLVSELNLAVYLWEVGERERAWDLMEHVVESYRQHFECDHRGRQTAECWLQHFQAEIMV